MSFSERRSAPSPSLYVEGWLSRGWLAGALRIWYGVKMKLRLVVEPDVDSNRWSAVFPELPGCGSAGDTEKEAVANANEVLALWFEPVEVNL